MSLTALFITFVGVLLVIAGLAAIMPLIGVTIFGSLAIGSDIVQLFVGVALILIGASLVEYKRLML